MPKWNSNSRVSSRFSVSARHPADTVGGRREQVVLHRLSAVDDQHGPSGEGRLIGAQVQDRGGDLLRSAHAADRLLADHRLSPFLRAAGEPIHHLGIDDAGRHNVDADLLRRIVERGRLRQPDDAVRCCGDDVDAASSGYRVGYGDASHFNREYKRLFGAPPMRDVARLREAIAVPRRIEIDIRNHRKDGTAFWTGW